jgi:hypothetical protein
MRFCPYAQRVHLVLDAKNIPWGIKHIRPHIRPMHLPMTILYELKSACFTCRISYLILMKFCIEISIICYLINLILMCVSPVCHLLYMVFKSNPIVSLESLILPIWNWFRQSNTDFIMIYCFLFSHFSYDNIQ